MSNAEGDWYKSLKGKWKKGLSYQAGQSPAGRGENFVALNQISIMDIQAIDKGEMLNSSRR